ncbi:Abi family protein [Alcaligenes nematophilus]|uniref:Abi family protein n=1 Tax=Alcaligenes TaxID=507 RepID=UPI0009B8B543|nr:MULTISPECIES: Abi family protein [Alcaligenes]MDH4867178.1 Abi family protein [Bacillus cereus]MDY7128485.1 Abi family protein [Alcaligenes nematophilus]
METSKHPLTKPPTTYDQQIAILRQRGIRVNDEEVAWFYLQHLTYYPLSVYWLSFEANHNPHQFHSGPRFEDAVNLYVFDRSLRLLVLDSIKRIEASARSQWAHHLAHQHDPHAHLDISLAANPARWHSDSLKLTKETQRSDEAFIRHLKAVYSESLPPVWAVCEVMSLELLSHWDGNLKSIPTRRAIA